MIIIGFHLIKNIEEDNNEKINNRNFINHFLSKNLEGVNPGRIKDLSDGLIRTTMVLLILQVPSTYIAFSTRSEFFSYLKAQCVIFGVGIISYIIGHDFFITC